MNMYEVWTTKAWFDNYPYSDYQDYHDLYVFAETPGQAKVEYLKAGFTEAEYTDLHVRLILKGVTGRERGLLLMGDEGEADSYHPQYDEVYCYINGTTGWPLHHVVMTKIEFGVASVDLAFGDTELPIIMSFDTWEEASRFAHEYEEEQRKAVRS